MFKSEIRIVLLIVGWMTVNCHGQWYGGADFIVPTRTVTSDNVFQRNTTEILDALMMPTGTFAVGTENLLELDLTFVAGGRLMLGYQYGKFGVEGTIMATDQWETSAWVSDPGGRMASPFTRVGSMVDPAVDLNTSASVAYQTEMQSLELNLTYLHYKDCHGDATFRFGVRTMSIDEYFQYRSVNPVMANTLVTTTENRLVGPQIGLRGCTPVWGGYLSLNTAGILAHNAIDRTAIFNGVTTVKNTGEASLLGEFGIEYLFLVNRSFAVRLGYQLLAVSDVGLAPNDVMISDDQTDHVLYQITYVGAVLTL